MSPVFRIEAFGEEGVAFPTLSDAMRDAPSHSEARVATSMYGVTLAEAQLASSPKRKRRYTWALTVAGCDVVAVRGWRVAS